MTTKLLLTETEVCALLSVSRTTLRRLWADNELVPLKIGRSIRYLPDDITEWISRQVKAVIK